MTIVRLFMAVSLCCLILVGCSGGPPAKPEGVKVSGKVLLPNGSPLTGGTLVLRPEAGLYGATAQIQSDGTFTLKDSNSELIVPGKYQVFVRFPNPNQAALATSVNQRYQQSSEDSDSDVVVDILEATEELAIRLKR